MATHNEPWRLDQFLKAQGVVGTGGEAKVLIQNGLVLLNQQVEMRRSCKLKPGDVVQVEGEKFVVPE